jgi:hypothetical protein
MNFTRLVYHRIAVRDPFHLGLCCIRFLEDRGTQDNCNALLP